MKIEFDNIPVKHLEHFNGGEGRLIARIYNDGTNKILKGLLEPGSCVGWCRRKWRAPWHPCCCAAPRNLPKSVERIKKGCSSF